MSYELLVSTLDFLRKEAPKPYKSYHPSPRDEEKTNQARAKALIHLFLKVHYGIEEFSARESFLCDGAQDGGIDGFYVDHENKLITLIQSKFRTTEKNFEQKDIEVGELIRMEVARVTKGEQTDSNGVQFSSKIRNLQQKIQSTPNLATYDWKVVLLANLKKYNNEQIKRLIDGMEFEVFDFQRTYSELLFPLTTGTSYVPSEVTIRIDLGKKQQPQLNQQVPTRFGECNIRMMYVPTVEIAKVTSKYKNALLRYNPRNYLSLKGNEVNRAIGDTIKNTTGNEFALKNNGITILAEYSSVTDRTGVSGQGQLVIKDPQIINGGQTATTLAMLLEEEKLGIASFAEKEVLLKIIEKPQGASDKDLSEFIEEISDSTNKQSKIVEADRRANDPKLIELQKYLFSSYGVFLERKRGEFRYGLDLKIIGKKDIVDRVELIRAFTAFTGEPQKARASQDRMFDETGFENLLKDADIKQVVTAYFLSRKLQESSEVEKSLGRRPGASKYALIYAASKLVPADSKDENAAAASAVSAVLSKWPNFESKVQQSAHNIKYKTGSGFNLDNYYKGDTVAKDISDYPWVGV